MVEPELVTRIRHLYYAEHWKVGTIASELGLHRETVQRAVRAPRIHPRSPRPSVVDPYVPFIQETLNKHPRLRATRIYQMIRDRGYAGSVQQLRRRVAKLRPHTKEAFLRLRFFPGEQSQIDWAHFGTVTVGQAVRRLSCFVMTLSWSRAVYLEFFFDQSQENFFRGHVRAFQDFQGLSRTLLYENLRSVVLERRGDQAHFHPRLLELAAHYHFQPRLCQKGKGSQKGRVERYIRFIRESFFAARPFTTLRDFNRQALLWRDQIAHARPWPDDKRKTVAQALNEERPRLLPLPAHPFDTERVVPVAKTKLIYARFDRNEYSIAPEAVGKTLSLSVSDTTVRVLCGTEEIARHRRSYDAHQRIEDPRHIEKLLEQKRRALGSTPSTRLKSAVPESEALLDAAFERGESVATQTQKLLLLLDDYGAVALRSAVQEALQRETPRASSVAYLLQRQQRNSQTRSPLAVDLTRRPDLAGLHVQPHDSETYDELSKIQDPDE
jgi:transposase